MPAPKDPIKRAEWIKKMSESSKGCIPWNKNLTKEMDSRLMQISKNRKGKFKHTLASIEQMSESHKGCIPWNKNLTKETDSRLMQMSKKRIEWLKEHPEWGENLGNSIKDKTYEERYGVETAISLKNKIRERETERLKKWQQYRQDKTWGELYGEERANEMKESCSLRCKGKTYEEIMLDKNKVEVRIKKASIRMTGEGNHQWLDGKSFEPYGLDFNDKFKEAIRARDNYCCVICNKMQEELNRKLDIHHIDYIKTNSFPQNCVSLCRRHHAETNVNRNAWIVYFQKLLSERYNYEYTQDQKIILDFMRYN